MPSTERAQRQRDALKMLDPYFWGPRVPLDDAAAEIRAWLQKHL